jgi:hypothetical protein
MGQLVPDGIKVVLKIFHKDLLISTLQETAQSSLIYIPSDFYKEKNYHFEIQTLGITKKLKLSL